MFIDEFERLCLKVGKSPSRVLTEIGLNKSAYTLWKRGGVPSNFSKLRVAEYFGISVEQLSGEKEKAPEPKSEAEELLDMCEDVRRNPNLKVLFSLSKNAKPEDVEMTIALLRRMKGSDGDSDY